MEKNKPTGETMSEGSDVPPDKEEQESDGEGVVIPEDFQQDVHNVLKKANTKHHLSHIRDRVYQKEDEMRKAEMKKESKGKKGKGPDSFSTDSAPSSLVDS